MTENLTALHQTFDIGPPADWLFETTADVVCNAGYIWNDSTVRTILCDANATWVTLVPCYRTTVSSLILSLNSKATFIPRLFSTGYYRYHITHV